MSDLSGSLSSFQLQQLGGFLSGLHKSGDLLLSSDHWIGSLSFDKGTLIAATVETEHGPPALEFIGAFMRRGAFEYFEGPPQQQPNLAGLGTDAVDALRRLVAEAPEVAPSGVPGPTAIPRLAGREGRDDADVLIPRAALYILVDVDGVRSVRDIAARHGLVSTVRALSRLRDLGIIDIAPGSADDAPTSAPPPSGGGSTISRPLGPARGAPARGGLPRRPLSDQSSPRPMRMLDRLPEWRAYLRSPRVRQVARDLAQAVIVTGVLVFSVRSVVENFRVEGVSMQPNFTAGEVIVVNRAAYLHLDQSVAGVSASQQDPRFIFGGPARGDIAVFRSPAEPGTNYIKRVIGLPGDSVLIHNGQVVVNGSELTEDYVRFPADYVFPGSGQAVVVPEATYFVLGDNRPDSFDSHTGWVVPADYLIGRAWLRYWPLDAWGMVQNAAPVMASAAATN